MFNPKIADKIQVEKQYYTFEEHPNAPGMVYGQDGKKACVYKVKQDETGDFFALKVFKPVYQNSSLLENSKLLAQLGDIEGLKVCQRKCITSQESPETIKSHPELEFALLMPWIEGSTWFDILTTKHEISIDLLVQFAQKLITLLCKLEQNGYAHCDLSSANIILSCKVENKKINIFDAIWIELIDIEDIFGPNLPKPNTLPRGTEGYRHPALDKNQNDHQWCVDGDRFSGAILFGELLCWHNEVFRKKVFAESYFDPKEMQGMPTTRYKLMISVLGEIGESLHDCFEAAWTSTKLTACPSITNWQESLEKCLNPLERLHSQMKKAIKNKVYPDVIRLGDEIRKSNNPLSKIEWIAYLEAHQWTKTNQRLDQAIGKWNEIELLMAFDNNIANSVIQSQQDSVGLAERQVTRWISLKRAINENDDKAICELFDPDLVDNSSLFSDAEKKVIEQARQRQAIVQTLRSAFKTQSPQNILQSYPKDLLQNSNLLTYDDLQKLDEAMQLINPIQLDIAYQVQSDTNPIRSLPDDDKYVVELWQNGKIKREDLPLDEDRQRLSLVIQRQGRIIRLQRALQQKNVERVRQLYNNSDLTNSSSSLFPFDLREQVEDFLSTH